MYTAPTENYQQEYEPTSANGSEPTEPARTYSAAETVFAWLCLFVGYVCARAFPMSTHPLGAFLFTLALLTASAVILAIKGCKFSLSPCIAAASSLVLSASLVFTINPFLSFLAYSYAFCTALYFVLATTGNTVGKGFDNMVLLDYVKAVFIMPMRSFGMVFCAIFSGKKPRGKVILKTFVGICAAIVPTIIVVALLSYDSDFSALINKVFDFGFADPSSHIFTFFLGVPVGMYLYGLYVSCADVKCRWVFTADKCRNTSRKLRVAFLF